MSLFRKLWKLIKSGKKRGNKEKKSSVKAVKKIHVKTQPLLAVAYHDAIIQWVQILSEKTFFQIFFAQVLSVKNFLYRYCKNYLGKLDSPDYKVIVSSRESCRLNTPPGTPSNSVDKND